MKDGTLQLQDGRTIGFGEHGAPDGIPVLFFHGTPGSRRMRHPNEAIAESRNLRIITVDRPGYGFSSFKQNRTFLDWADDIFELTVQLRVSECSIIAFSGGGPYALSCAYKLAGLVRTVILLNSVGPFSADTPSRWNWPITLAFRTAEHAPWLLNKIANTVVAKARKNFDACFDWGASKLPDVDRKILLRPEIKNVFKESLTEAFRQGQHAFVSEVRMLTRPWGFPLVKITQPVYLWHGERDSFHEGHSLAKALPYCTASFVPGEGHLVFFDHWEEILDQLPVSR